MRRSTALGLLPAAHARALDLVEQGLDTEELADRLHLDPSAVDPLLRVARAKLAALEALDEPPSSLSDRGNHGRSGVHHPGGV
jgi:DNA-directed RNA polymerase specialized sigma24 family protein